MKTGKKKPALYRTALVLTAVTALCAALMSGSAAAEGQRVYRIGVLQTVSHPTLDDANRGFFAALDEAGVRYEADQQNAGGDMDACISLARRQAGAGNDLIFALLTPAAQASAAYAGPAPVLFTAVTDPAGSGLVQDNGDPGERCTGTSDAVPVESQISLLLELVPKAETVGFLYDPENYKSSLQAAEARGCLEASGLRCIDYPLDSTGLGGMEELVRSMAGAVDAVYVPFDSPLAAILPEVTPITDELGIPVIAGDLSMVEAGALASCDIDYYELGCLTGRQAVRILTEGADITHMPVEYLPADRYRRSFNQETAARLGIAVPDWAAR